MLTLDSLDKQILYHLDHNGRDSFTEIARSLKKGRDIIEYRIRRLEDQGIIAGYKAILDPYRFGLTLYKSYIKLAASKKEIRKIITHLRKEKHVFWITDCDGAFDLIVSIASYSPLEFHQLQAKLFTPINSILISWDVYNVVNFRLYRLKYLKESGTKWWEIGNLQTEILLDKVDYTILEILSENGRTSLTELSESLQVSMETVKNRIAKLERDKYILGYQATINLDGLKMTRFKAQLFLNNFDLKQEEQLRSYCNKHPNIIAYILQIGRCRTEIEIHVSDYEDYIKIIEELRSKFTNLIHHVDTILMGEEHFNWGTVRRDK